MNHKILGSLAAVLIIGPAVANADLLSTDGGLGVYDTTLNTTWLSNANLLENMEVSYTNGTCGAAFTGECIAAFNNIVIADSGGVISDAAGNTYTLSQNDFQDGLTDYPGALAFVKYLNVTDYGGSNQWALPSAVDSPSTETDELGPPPPSSSELAELFYGELGQVFQQDIRGTHNANFNLFSGLNYDEAFGEVARDGATYYFINAPGCWGCQYPNADSAALNVMAVSPGRVSAPEIDPASAASGLALFLGGLLALRGRRPAHRASA